MADEQVEPTPSPTAPSGPKIERTADFLALYSNHVQVETSAWDLTMNLGQFDKFDGKSIVRQRASVTFAWPEVKAICNLLLTNLVLYEAYNDPVKMPRDMKQPPLILPNPQNDPKTVAVNERLAKILELVFGEE